MLRELIFKKSKIAPTNPAPIDYKHMKRFIVSHFWMIVAKLNIYYPKHIREQVQWRMSKSLPCLENGSCLTCGCTTNLSFYLTKEGCDNLDNPCYPNMMSKEEWNKFKLNNYAK